MQQKKLGPLLLSALMTGPILGSGIIILPPIAQVLFNRFAILAWGVMMCLGGLFAMVFVNLALKFPGPAGFMSLLAGKINRGRHWEEFFFWPLSTAWSSCCLLFT